MGQAKCTPCPDGLIAGSASSKCEVCMNKFVVLTSDDSRQTCQIDTKATIYLALFMLSISICVHLGLKSLSFYAVAISDVTINKGRMVISTRDPHRILRWTWVQPIVQLRDTSVPQLDHSKALFRVKASGGKHLILTHKDPEKAMGDFVSSSMGTLVIGFMAFWCNAGILGIPFCAWLLPILAVAACSATQVQPLMSGIISFFATLIFLALRLWKQLALRTPISQARQRFAKQLLKGRVPTPCERGTQRALHIDNLQDLHEFFSAFIHDRSMYYVCSNLVQPLTKPFKLSYAELVGPTETAWFVSHYWGMGFRHFVDAVACHARSKEAAGVDANYWICTFSNNQWRIEEELGDGAWQESSFFKALRGPSCKGTVMVLDEAALPLQRAWCLFEVLQTNLRSAEDTGFLGFRLCTSTGVLNEGGVGTDLCMTIAGKLVVLDLRNAQASNQNDLQMIKSLVEAQAASMP